MPFDTGTILKKHTNASVLLLRAAEIISREEDWNVGTAYGRGGRLFSRHSTYCAIGAVRYARSKFDLGDKDGKTAQKFLNMASKSHGFQTIEALNDHPDTTHALVLQVFQEAADLAMAE